jgi:hypothetical protein
VGGGVLEVSRLEDLLAGDGEDLGEEVLDVVFGEDLLDGLGVQLF